MALEIREHVETSESLRTSVRLDALTVTQARPEVPEWGSDVAVEMLRRLGVEYIALNPGASYRGFHDSLVNYNANQGPGMVLCNHEEIAIAVAHGYSKLRGKAMAAAVHSNVGLMHATMGVFNAWVDRAPMLIFGGTGPMDSTQRRPWIDWVHTSFGQGEIIRDFTKWEHQPGSVAAIPEAMLRAWQVMHLEPRGPVYMCLDVGLQEQRIDPAQPVPIPDIEAFPLPSPIEPPREAVEQAARWLVEAAFPVILLGRGGQTDEDWRTLVELAESLGAAVLTDLRSPASFPTSHPLHAAAPATRPGADFLEVLAKADLVLSLDRIDLGGTLRSLEPNRPERPQGSVAPPPKPGRLINVSLEPLAVRSWSGEYYEMAPVDLPILASVAPTVRVLREAVERRLADAPERQRVAAARFEEHRARKQRLQEEWAKERQRVWDRTPINVTRMLGELRGALGNRYSDAVLARGPLGWARGGWDFEKPGASLGSDGGAGVGSGPGMVVGAALAAKGSGRTVVGVLGDGDLLMTPQALWTAAHHALPLLMVVVNNQSYFNDEEHQERVALTRGRPVENRWIGQRMDQPAVDFAGLARDLGAEGVGPVKSGEELQSAFSRALRAVDEGQPALVDVRMASR